MIICEKVVALVAAFCEPDELQPGGEVVTKMKVTRGLSPGNNGHFSGVFVIDYPSVKIIIVENAV